MSNRAKKRKEEQYKRALARIMEMETRDQLFEFATVTEVDLSPDFMYAKVFVDVPGELEQGEKAVDKMNEDEGFFRARIAEEVDPRYTPELDFKLDRSRAEVEKIERIIREDRDNQAEGGNS